MSTSPSTTSQIDNDPGDREQEFILTENELLEELAANYPVRRRRSGGVTARELAEKIGSMAAARRVLKLEKDRGEIYFESVIEDGHPVKVWYKRIS